MAGQSLQISTMKLNKSNVTRRSLIRWKIYFDRSRMYVGYIQFFLIGIVFLQSFKDHEWAKMFYEYAIVSIPLLMVIFILLSLLLGYFDTKLGFREEELRNLTKSNPVMMEMLVSLKEIKERLKSIEQTTERDN